MLECLKKIKISVFNCFFASEELPDSIQHTKEREPDVLKKVIDRNGRAFVLQIEFQAANDPKMVYRMAEYYIMLRRKYDLPTRQYVIYIGEHKLHMPVELRDEYLTFRYSLVSLLSVNYRLFLDSEKPEEKLLALLADFGTEDPVKATENIVRQVMLASGGGLEGQRYMQQLRILSKLRKLVSLNSLDMSDITKYILEQTDITTDLLYQRGEEIGIAEGQKEKSIEVVKNLLAIGQFSIAQIASIAGVSEAFVLDVRGKLK